MYTFPADARWEVLNDRVLSAAVEVVCKECDRSEKLTFSGSQITAETVTEPTCAQPGLTMYSVTAEIGGQSRTYAKTLETPAWGHVWEDEAVTWSADHSTATFTFRCITCDETVTKTVESSAMQSVASTCEQGGQMIYSASARCGETSVTASEGVPIPATGHDWDVTGEDIPLEYGVAGDLTTVTITCRNDEHHKATAYTSLTRVEDKCVKAECETAGKDVYQMTYAFGGETYALDETACPAPALGHDYKNGICTRCGAKDPTWDPAVEYTWDLPENNDTARVHWSQPVAGGRPYVTVKAIRTGSDGSVLTQDVTAADVKVAKRTEYCEKTGTTTYEATVTVGGVSGTYATTLTDVPPTGHLWVDDGTAWSTGDSEVTFTFVCLNDETHVKEVTVQTVIETVEAATCENTGLIRRYAAVELEGTTAEADKYETTAALGHNWGVSPDDAVPPRFRRSTDDAGAQVYTVAVTCRNDPSHIRTADQVILERVRSIKAATCTARGQDLYRVSYKLDGQTYVLRDEVFDTPMTAHDWGEWTESTDGSGSVTYTRTCKVCGEKEISSHMHQYAFPEEARWNVQNGELISVTVDLTCTECGGVESWGFGPDSELVTKERTEPTCDKDGGITFTLTVEGHTYTYDVADVPALGHVYKNGVCSRCGAKDPNYGTSAPTATPGTCAVAPDTGDETALLPWTALLLACAGALVLLTRRRRPAGRNR